MLLRTLSAALLLGALAGCSRPEPSSVPETGPGPRPLTKIRLKTDWYPQGEHGGFYQAIVKGYYKEAGLDVEIIPGGPGVAVPQIMIAGQADIAVGRSDDLIVQAQQGLPFVIVGTYMQHDPQALLLHEEDPAKGFADLDNRSIMATPGVYWMEYLRVRYHLNLREIPINYGIAQFMADPRFVQQCFLTNEPYYVAKNGGHPKVFQLSESGYDPYRILFTTQGFLKGHEDAVRAFVAASTRGWVDFMNGDASQARAQILKANENMTDEFISFSMKSMKEHFIVEGRTDAGEKAGLLRRKRIQDQIDVLAQLKIIPHPIPLEEFVRFDVVPADLHD
jgi:NitT/TauT family transport system substrate-binding protein